MESHVESTRVFIKRADCLTTNFMYWVGFLLPNRERKPPAPGNGKPVWFVRIPLGTERFQNSKPIRYAKRYRAVNQSV
jgi:hypothetical protein